MAQVTRRNLVLTFTNTVGKEVNLTVNEPAEDMEGEALSSIMDEIIASAAFGAQSLVANKKEAKYVVQEEEELVLA